MIDDRQRRLELKARLNLKAMGARVSDAPSWLSIFIRLHHVAPSANHGHDTPSILLCFSNSPQ